MRDCLINIVDESHTDSGRGGGASDENGGWGYAGGWCLRGPQAQTRFVLQKTLG